MAFSVKEALKEVRDSLGLLLWPPLCEVCGCPLMRGEKILCLHCRLGLPLLHGSMDSSGPLYKRLLSTVPLERVGSCFSYYRNDPYARLIHVAKYEGRPSVVRQLAAQFCTGMVSEGFFEGVDMLVPVPLHPFRLMRRGYNQSRYIALGLRDATGIPVRDLLKVTRRHGTQTRKGSYARWENARGAYALASREPLDGKHIMIVDDVLTSGATVLACAGAILSEWPGARASSFTLCADQMV